MENELRKAIIAEMQRKEIETNKDLGEHLNRSRYCSYCTWWFKFHIACTTAQARRELEKMEVEGIVIADRTQTNNTKWLLVEEVNHE